MRSADTSSTLDCFISHLRERLLVRIEPELRDEPQAANDPQRILGEARRRHGAQCVRVQIGAAAVGIDEHPIGQTTCHRVHGEVAAGVGPLRPRLPGRPRSRSRGAASPVETSRRGGASRSPAGRACPLPDRRAEAHANRSPRDDELLRAPLRPSAARSPSISTPGTRNSASWASLPSSSSTTPPPTTYASRPSDRTELLDLPRRGRSPRSRRARPTEAWRPRRSTAPAASSRRGLA